MLTTCNIIVAIIALFLHHDVTALSTSSGYHEVKQNLLSRQASVSQVPPGGGMAPVNVSVEFIPMDVLDVDDVNQVVSVTCELALSWVDPELTWDPSNYSGVVVVEVHSEDVWIPAVTYVNGASEPRINTFSENFLVTVFASGNVTVIGSPIIRFTCALDLKFYPYDTQRCHLQFIVMSSTIIHAMPSRQDIMAFRRKALQSQYEVAGEWILQDVEVRSVEDTEVMIGNIFLDYVLVLKRKTTFFVISFIVPLALTSYMNTLVFVIPAESGERVSYLVSIFVSNAVFVSFCTSQMPQGMDSTPRVTALLLGSMVEAVIFIVIISLLSRFRQSPPPSDDSAQVISKALRDVITHLGGAEPNAMAGDRSRIPVTKNEAKPVKAWALGSSQTKVFPQDLRETSNKLDEERKRGSGHGLDIACFVVALVVNTAFVASSLLVIAD